VRSPALPRRRRPVWTDRWAVGLGLLDIALDGALAIVLWYRFDALPELIGLHFNAYGEVDLIASKSEIFRLPLIGMLVWAANAALAVVAGPHDRVLARVALGTAAVVQALLCVAAWRILS
jgi:hypothetical protein